MELTAGKNQWLEKLARTGLAAKGFVYSLIGILAFMAAFEIASQSTENADRAGVMSTVKNMPGGTIILGALVAGLVCYSVWRMFEAFGMKNKKKNWPKKIRYVFSALSYLLIAYAAFQVLMYNDSGESNSHWSQEFIYKDFGKILVGAIALAMAGIGIYQIYYGFSEKYRKKFSGSGIPSSNASILLRSGKIGYAARGVVWLIISYLLIRALLNARASEAGDTAKAFGFIESSSYGSYLLGTLGLGLLAFGFYNFLRAAYEEFKME